MTLIVKLIGFQNSFSLSDREIKFPVIMFKFIKNTFNFLKLLIILEEQRASRV